MAGDTFQLDLISGIEISLAQTLFAHTAGGVKVRCVRGKDAGPSCATGSFQWTSAVKAVCLVALQTLLADYDGKTPPYIAGLRGSPASSLDYAIAKEPEWIAGMFGVAPAGYCMCKRVFSKSNSHMKRPGPVLIGFNRFIIPRSVIHIFLDGSKIREYCSVIDLWRRLNGLAVPCEEVVHV